ncbi:hypothetical protein RUND412_001423 [Rhizina undulata]
MSTKRKAEFSDSSKKRTRSTSVTLSTTSTKKSNGATDNLIEYKSKPADESYIHLQRNPCANLGNKFKFKNNQFEKCVRCIEKQAAAGTCRLVGIRIFKDVNGRPDYLDFSICSTRDADTEAGKLAIETNQKWAEQAAKAEAQKLKSQAKAQPVSQRSTARALRPPQPAREDDVMSDSPHIANKVILDKSPETLRAFGNYVLLHIAPDFGKMLKQELHHEQSNFQPLKEDLGSSIAVPHARILPPPATRAICDICATSIFLGSYICACCGKELCLSCWEEWKPSTERISGGLNRRIDQCSRKRRHERMSFYFITRATEGEISGWLKQVEPWVHGNRHKQWSSDPDQILVSTIPTIHEHDPRPDGPMYLPVIKAAYEDVPLEKFRAVWRIGGIPLVLSGFRDRFDIRWTPEYFMENFGDHACRINDCDTGLTKNDHVSRFFKGFSKAPEGSLKLKDWPPSEDFADIFPDLFQDFENALPYPEYTTRKGTLNLASYFPADWLRPDLGPKMYNAYPSVDFLPPKKSKNGTKTEIVVKGTTNLHFDVTDAINIMMHASGDDYADDSASIQKGIPFCGAIWEIFPPEASDHIRKYLKAYKGATEDDPIHRQIHYLDEDDLAELNKSENGSVKAYRIYQNPGDAVFVPAGCAHQVRNRRSCVKVAVDFLSCEHVSVCAELMNQHRLISGACVKSMIKEDILQLWNCLMFSWSEFGKWADVADLGADGGGGGDDTLEVDGKGVKGSVVVQEVAGGEGIQGAKDGEKGEEKDGAKDEEKREENDGAKDGDKSKENDGVKDGKDNGEKQSDINADGEKEGIAGTGNNGPVNNYTLAVATVPVNINDRNAAATITDNSTVNGQSVDAMDTA